MNMINTTIPVDAEVARELVAHVRNRTTDKAESQLRVPIAHFTSPDTFGSTEKFVKLFQAKYNKPPDYAQASSSAAGVVLQLAIEKAGTIDPEKVRDMLASTVFQTFYGPIKFGPSGQNVTADNPIFQIQNKKIVILAPDNVKAGDLQLMK